MSTVQALLNHMQFTYDSIDSGNFVISVFLDFKKAFDTVDHKILLSKLDFYGIRGVSHEWLKSYLSERNQITVIDAITSSSSSISHGVPHGSVLCPLLFLIFINDLPKSSLFKFILFADDSTLSTSFPEENALEFTLTLNHELNNVNNWLTSYSICINGDKTKCKIFSYRKLLHLTNIKIGSATIEETNNIKFFGIIFDKHLTFKHNVDVIAR